MNEIDTKRIGRDILYCLGTGEVAQIIRERREAGLSTHRGNEPRAGQWFPGKIVADFGSTRAAWQVMHDQHVEHMSSEQRAQTYEDAQRAWSVNIQVQLDGTDALWATSRQMFDPKVFGRFVLPDDVAGPNDIGAVEPDYSEYWVADPEGHWIFA